MRDPWKVGNALLLAIAAALVLLALVNVGRAVAMPTGTTVVQAGQVAHLPLCTTEVDVRLRGKRLEQARISGGWTWGVSVASWHIASHTVRATRRVTVRWWCG